MRGFPRCHGKGGVGMKYLTLLKGNIRQQRGSFIGITVLIFIISTMLCAVLAVVKNGASYESEQLDRVGYGDVTAWVLALPGLDDMTKKLEALDETEKVGRQKVFYVKYIVKGEEISTTGQVIAYDPGHYDYHLYEENLRGLADEPTPPKEGEIYVPPSFCSLYDVQIGDVVEVEITGADDTESFTVAGFFEDPFMGSAMMGFKSMQICDEEMERLKSVLDDAGEEAIPQEGEMLHIYKSEDCELSMHEFQMLINEKTNLKAYTFNVYTRSAIEGFMLIVQNIFAGFLLVFVVVLFGVTMLVLSHSITTGIEQDFTNMGILKALGFTKKKLCVVKQCQYLLAVVLGMALGVPAALPVVTLVNRIMVTTTGLMVPTALPTALCAAALGTIFLLLGFMTVIKVSRIGKITPLTAIRGGAEDVYWESRFTTRIYDRGLNLHLALRQLSSGRKQYISVCVVTALLVFFLSLTARIGAWMGPDGAGMMDSFNAVPYDIGVRASNDETAKAAEEMIADETAIVQSYEFVMLNGTLDGVDYVLNVCSKPEVLNLLEGRTCMYDNEILVTEIVAEALEKGIGDTVTVEYEGESREFIISGIYECANDMGMNFAMSSEGAAKLGMTDDSLYYTCYQLEDASVKEVLADRIEERFGDAVKVDRNDWTGISVITGAMKAVELLMYAITVLFVLVAIGMTGSRILYREKRDLGIYKSLGFSSARLRLTFALRFGIVALLGAVPGILLSEFLTDPLAVALLKICGISRFSSHLTLIQMIVPALQVALLFVLFSYLAAGKIKKVEPRILIIE